MRDCTINDKQSGKTQGPQKNDDCLDCVNDGSEVDQN